MIYIKYWITFILLVALVVINVIMIGRPWRQEVNVLLLSLYIVVIWGMFWKYW